MLVERRVEHVPCTFVGGEKRTEHYAAPGKGVYISGPGSLERVSLGKEYAVGRLLAILDNNRVLADASPIWRELRKELLSFEMTPGALHSRYGATPGQHDDLITALALCVQADPPKNGDDHAVPGCACRRTAGGGSRVDTRSTQPQHPFAGAYRIELYALALKVYTAADARDGGDRHRREQGHEWRYRGFGPTSRAGGRPGYSSRGRMLGNRWPASRLRDADIATARERSGLQVPDIRTTRNMKIVLGHGR